MTAAPVDRAAVLAATLREVLDTFGPMREVYGGPVSYYDGSADIEPEQYERWRAVLDAEPAPAAELRRMADEERDEREAQANLDTLADLLPRMADEALQPETRVVAYRSPGGFYLYCTRHYDELGPLWPPVTSEDLPDGGICTKCGVDVLISQQPEAAEGVQR